MKMRDCMDRRVTPSKRVTSPTWGPPPPCKQALSHIYDIASIFTQFCAYVRQKGGSVLNTGAFSYDELFVITFSFLMRWQRNFAKNYRHYSAIIWNIPISLMVNIFCYWWAAYQSFREMIWQACRSVVQGDDVGTESYWPFWSCIGNWGEFQI